MKKVFYIVFLTIFLVGIFYFPISETWAYSSSSDYTLHNVATANVAPGTTYFLIYDIELPDPTDTLVDVSEITPEDGSSLSILGESPFYTVDVNSNSEYDANELILYEDWESGVIDSSVEMYEAGLANVTLFDSSDKVYFEDADADGFYTSDTPEIIWYDVGDTGVFDAGVDWVLVGDATPDCVSYNCIEVSTLVGANKLAYWDNTDSINAVYDSQKETADSSEVIFVPGADIESGANVPLTSVFLDAADIDEGDDAGGSWLPLLYPAGEIEGVGFNLSSYEVGGESDEILVYKENPRPNGKLNTSNLSRFDIVNLGTAVNTDFGYGESNVLVAYLDDGDGIFDNNTDTFVNYARAYDSELNAWTFYSYNDVLGYLPNPEITPTSRRLFVAALSHSSAVLDKTIQMSSGLIGDGTGFDFDSEFDPFLTGLDGPNDEALTNSGIITIGSVAPDAITNLACQPSGQGGAVFLSWTIPEGIVEEGYGYTGQYDQGSSITWDADGNSTYGTTWAAGTAGSSTQQLVTGLNPNTQYSFILHAIGESESESEDSNAVTCYAPSSLGSGTTDATSPTSEITSTDNKKISGRAKDTGGSSIQKVEISLDNGSNWTNTAITSSDNTYSYFEYNYSNLAVGTYQVKTRATDWIGNIETPGVGTSLVVLTSTSTTTPVISTTTPSAQTTAQIQQTLTTLRTQLLQLLLKLLQILQGQLAGNQ